VAVSLDERRKGTEMIWVELNRGRDRAAALAIASVALFSSGAATVSGAPTSFEVVFEGRHVPATIPSSSGLMHVGTFTASPPFCRSGTVADLEFHGSAAVTRSYTCGDGSGTMTLRSTVPAAEHETEADGSWRILGGTGNYAALRGKGAWASVRLAGDPTDSSTVVFRSTLRGIADLDDVAPRIIVSRATATKLRRPAGAYLVRIRFSAADNVEGNVVSYLLEIAAGSSPLAGRAGRTASGSVTLAFRIRPPKRSRSVRVEIKASDPLDNDRTLARTIRLRRS
jgi:hypothetical protein